VCRPRYEPDIPDTQVIWVFTWTAFVDVARIYCMRIVSWCLCVRVEREGLVLQKCVVYDITMCLCFGKEMPFLKFCDKPARFLRTMLYFVFNNPTGHVIPYDRRAFTADPVRLTTNFPYVFGLPNCWFARRCNFRNMTPSDWLGDGGGSPKREGNYVNSIRDEQMDVVWTLIRSGDLICDIEKESEDEKMRIYVHFFLIECTWRVNLWF
jgi:hypothetical protein